MGVNGEAAIVRRRAVDPAEVGAFARLRPEDVLRAARLVNLGRVYDLGTERFRGMPLPAMHPPFELMTYRSPRGMANDGDQAWLQGEANESGFAFATEMVFTSLHTGTHMDTLAHVNVGADHHWYGGFSADEHLGDFGPRKADASTLSPLFCRGVLLDVAGHKKAAVLPGGSAISGADLQETAASQQMKIEAGDVALIRTGYMSLWPDGEKMRAHHGAGIDLAAARWLAGQGVIAVGSDTEAVEQLPAAGAGNPHPVHTFMLVERGIPLIELLDLEQLAADRHYTFLFVGLPLKIRGGTAGLLDPIAVV